jgi:hypothetical protein
MIERMRQTLAAALPPGAFLKRDRGEALFVTDAPRRGPCPDWAELDFEAAEAGGLAHLTPGAGWLLALEAACDEPPDFLCASLRRFTGPPEDGARRLFAQGLKCLDDPRQFSAYDRALRQRAAAALRGGVDGGGLYACALLRHQILQSIERRESP